MPKRPPAYMDEPPRMNRASTIDYEAADFGDVEIGRGP